MPLSTRALMRGLIWFVPGLRRAPQETVGAVNAGWQGEILRDIQTPPPPLRAAPPECRIKKRRKSGQFSSLACTLLILAL